VAGFNASTHALTVTSHDWPDFANPGTGHGYFGYHIEDLVQLIAEEGQCAFEDLGGGSFRVYAWAYGGGDPGVHLMEIPRRPAGVMTANRKHWIIDNFEFRHAGTGLGGGNVVGASNLIVRNCLAHHNGGVGIDLCGDGAHNLISHCTSVLNTYGITFDGSDCAVENCEVAWNGQHGVYPLGQDNGAKHPDKVLTVRNCYLHDHMTLSHGDNIHAFNGVETLVLDGNYIICSRQLVMNEGGWASTFSNNVFIGGQQHGAMSSPRLTIVRHNTALFADITAAYGGWDAATRFDSSSTMEDNLVQAAHSSAWVIYPSGGNKRAYTSDYNCFWRYADNGLSPVLMDGNTHDTWEQYKKASGQDQHSVLTTDPLLANIPAYTVPTDRYRQYHFTPTRIFLEPEFAMSFEVGDHVEVDWDGVMRTVTTVGPDYIDFAPGDDKFRSIGSMINNWGNKKDCTLDLTPLPGSPIIGQAQDHSNIGSAIHIADYKKSDFNGDGRRDIPNWPPLAARLDQWEALVNNVATLAQEGYTESRPGGLTRLRLRFDNALDAATVASKPISIVGQKGGDLTSLVALAALNVDGKVLTVILSSKLPEGDRYTLTAGPALKALGGGPVCGARSIQISVAAGKK
jgi:hypothetical protein